MFCVNIKEDINNFISFFPIYITFLAKDNTLYNITVTDKENEKGLLKLLRIN